MIDKQAVFSEWNDLAWFANIFKDLSRFQLSSQKPINASGRLCLHCKTKFQTSYRPENNDLL